AVSVGGSAIGDFVVGGTLAAPRIDGTLDANDVRYDAVGPAAIHSRLSASRTEVAVDDLQATLGANSAHGRGRVSLASEKIDGRFDAALKHVSRLAGAVALPIDITGTLDASATLSGSLTAPSVAATVTTKNLVAASQQIDRLEADARLV